MGASGVVGDRLDHAYGPAGAQTAYTYLADALAHRPEPKRATTAPRRLLVLLGVALAHGQHLDYLAADLGCLALEAAHARLARVIVDDGSGSESREIFVRCSASPAVHILQAYDEYLVGHADSKVLITADGTQRRSPDELDALAREAGGHRLGCLRGGDVG